MATTYTVICPLVIVKDEDGKMHHVYEAGVLPDNADADDVKRLLDDGMIAKTGSKAAEEAAAPTTGDDGETVAPAKKATAKK